MNRFSTLSKSTFPFVKYYFLAYYLNTIGVGPERAFFSWAYKRVNPSNNLFVTVAYVTPNLADGDISAVPSLSIAECSPPIPLACKPNYLAVYLSFF